MFTHLTEEERKHINRVRIYNSKDDLEQHKDSDFDDIDGDACEKVTPISQAELFEMA